MPPNRIDTSAGRCYTSGDITWRQVIGTVQLQISEAAKRAGVSVRTVGFYEEKGLLEPSGHTSGGIRLYSSRDVTQLIFIRRLATLGLSLDEIKGCLEELPESSARDSHAKHTLKLLEMQKERLAEQRARLVRLEEDIEDSMAKVSRCVKCRAEQCPEQCPSYGQVL